MYSSAVLRQTHKALIVQFTELQNLRNRVLKAEQRLLEPKRRASGRRVLGKRPRRRGRSLNR
jgi:hypothetical protein